MHVKMTRIESGVTVPKGLFTLYVNAKIVTAKIFFTKIDISGVPQLTPQRKLTCADSNNITGTIDSFFLFAFLIELCPPIPLIKRG
jgi:hypothetical protein